MKKKYTIILLFFLTIACNNDPKINNIQDTVVSSKKELAFEKAKEIYYSLPSPVETAMVLENTNVEYSDYFLLPTKYVDYYVKSDDQAVNLGIYVADLSYITLFDQQQKSAEYLNACKKLVDKLGLINVIDDSVLNVLSENILNKNETMNLISEQFMNINAYLEENNREISTTLMILGGWVEGLFLSVNLMGDNVMNNPELVQMIYDQRISLEDLISLMEMYKNEKEIFQYLQNIYELKAIYQKMETPMNQTNFLELRVKVEKLRFSFTNQKI